MISFNLGKLPGDASDCAAPIQIGGETYTEILQKRNLSVEFLAERARMSPRNSCAVYKQNTGRTPAKAVELFRLEAVRHLLGDSSHNVDQIAHLCGFGDEERMRVAFQRNLKMIDPRHGVKGLR